MGERLFPQKTWFIQWKSQYQSWDSFLWLRVREALEALQTIQVIATVLGCPPKLSSKTILLKMLYTLVAERRNIQAELTWKIPPWWPAFIVAEGAGAVQAVGEESASTISLQKTLTGPMCPTVWWHDSYEGNQLLLNTGLVLWTQSCKSPGLEGHGPKKEPATVVLLNYTLSYFLLDVSVHELVLSLAMARGASFCGEQQLNAETLRAGNKWLLSA